MEPMDLASAWIDAAKAQLFGEALEAYQEDAIIRLFELSSDDPETALQVIYKILKRDPGSEVVRYLGAGPLEELLVRHCDYLEAVIVNARQDPVLKQCLSQVDLDLKDCANAGKLHEVLGRMANNG